MLVCVGMYNISNNEKHNFGFLLYAETSFNNLIIHIYEVYYVMIALFLSAHHKKENSQIQFYFIPISVPNRQRHKNSVQKQTSIEKYAYIQMSKN